MKTHKGEQISIKVPVNTKSKQFLNVKFEV